MADYDEFDDEIEADDEDAVPFQGIFGDNKNLELIQLLISVPDISLNKSQLKRVLGISFNTVTKILKKLEEFDIVRETKPEKGNGKIYRLNGDSLIVKFLDQLHISINGVKEPEMLSLLMPVQIPNFHHRRKATIEIPEDQISEHTGPIEAEIFGYGDIPDLTGTPELLGSSQGTQTDGFYPSLK